MDSLLTTSDWNSIGSAILNWVGQAILYGTLTALAAWALLWLVRRRISPAIQGLFWTVVLVKFIVPVGPGSLYSLATLVNRSTAMWSSAAPQAQIAIQTAKKPILVVVEDQFAANAHVAPAAAVEASTPLSVGALCGIAYVIIVAGIAAWRMVGYVRFARHCRMLPAVDDDARRLVDDVCRRHGVRRLRDVRISGNVAAPFILGGLRPLLVLSPKQTQPAELEAVVLHEIAHLRRRDLIVRYVQWFAGTMLFFWPVVAWVNRRIDLAREHACDDWALRHSCLSAGDYARCLLRALHRPEPIRLAYRPASMARNLKSVERRIDMIMDSPRQRSFRSLTLPAILALGAWSAFALSGAQAEDTKQEAAEAQKAEGKTPGPQTASTEVRVIRVAGEEAGVEPGGPMEVKVVKNEKGEMEVQINGKTVHNIDVPGIKMNAIQGALGGAWCTEEIDFVSPETLDQFGKDHPTADADGNGKVTREERSAYLAVLAQSSPADVIAKFPTADLNKDNTIDAMEAARLVTGGAMDIEAFEVATPNVITETKTGADGQVMVVRKGTMARTVHAFSAVPPPAGQTGELPMKMAFKALPLEGMGAGKWLLDNVKATPTAADVARMLPTVEEAPLARYAEMFPDADSNKDGRVSKDERTAHKDKQMSDVRARMLKRHPEADKDGDGKLSSDEEKEYFRKAAQRIGKQTAGKGIFIQKGENGGPETTFDIHVETDGEEVGDGDVIIQTEVEHIEIVDEKSGD